MPKVPGFWGAGLRGIAASRLYVVVFFGVVVANSILRLWSSRFRVQGRGGDGRGRGVLAEAGKIAGGLVTSEATNSKDPGGNSVLSSSLWVEHYRSSGRWRLRGRHWIGIVYTICFGDARTDLPDVACFSASSGWI